MVKPIVLLTIDDDEAMRRSVRGYFEDLDFEVLEAEDGTTGLAVFRNTRPDVVLVDLRMPGLSGLEVIQVIAEEAPEIPVLVLSGTGIIGDAIDAIRKGAWDFVTKPIVEMAHLRHVVSMVLERARLRSESSRYREHLEDEVARRTHELTEINNRLKAIVQSTRTVAACSGIQEVSSRLLEEFASNMAAEGGSIYLVEEGKLVLKFSLDEGHTSPQIPLPPPEDSAIRKALETKQPLVIRDLSAERDISPSGWSGYRDPSLLIFPLLDDRNDPVGVITLHNKTNPPFTEQDRELGIILSSYSCEAIRASRAVEALRDSEERFKRLVQNSNDIITVTDKNGIQTSISGPIERVLGYKPEELVGTSGFEIIHPDDMEPLMRAFAEGMMRPGSVGRAEYRCRHKDGSWIAMEAVGTNLLLDPVVKGVVLNVRDISERRRAEKALRESEQKYRLLAENVSDVIFTMDLDLRVTYVSPSVEETNGWTTNEWMSLNPSDYLVPASLELVLKAVRDELALQDNPGVDPDRVRTLELEQYRKDRTTFWTEVSARFLYDETGCTVGIIGATRDISDRKRHELAQRRLATALEQAGEAVVITDPDGTVEYVNPAFERMTGYSREEVLGEKHSLLKDVAYDQGLYRNLEQTLSLGLTWGGRLEKKRKDGAHYYEDVTISPVKDSSGNTINFVAIRRDISQEVGLQQQLFQAQKMEAIGTLAGGIAHDFNNLLQAILGYSELLLMKKEQRDPDRKKLEVIRSTARDGADLVSRILTFSRKADSRARPIDLNEEVRKAYKLMRRTVSRMIEIDLTLEDPLHVIDADPAQVEQILLNLAVNSQHALPEGGRIVIETSNVSLSDAYARTHTRAEPGQYVLLAFSDNGIGIKPEFIDRIYEPFFTTKTEGEGTGLGLAMVHGIVSQHGGDIRCYSEPGIGTSFQIYFPVSATELISDLTETLEMPAFGSETILLVDDDDRVRDVARQMIELGGYKVITAGSGEDALQEFADHRHEISLVILDLIMPGMGGRRCLQELLQIDPAVKVLIASGYSSIGLSQNEHGWGAKGFVSKPYDAKDILAAIRKVLDLGERRAS